VRKCPSLKKLHVRGFEEEELCDIWERELL